MYVGRKILLFGKVVFIKMLKFLLLASTVKTQAQKFMVTLYKNFTCQTAYENRVATAHNRVIE